MDRNSEQGPFTIRKFREKDREAVVEITLLAFDGVSIDQAIEKRWGLVGGKSWQDRKRLAILQDLEQHAAHTWVAETDGRVVGYITSDPSEETKIGWIPNLAVHPDYHGRGIGRALLETVLEDFRRRGMVLAKLEVVAHNTRAFGLYRRLGFGEVSRQLHMVRPLAEAGGHE